MKNKLSVAILAAGLAVSAANSYAVDVVVNSTQPEVAGTSYQTINGALNYVKTQAEPRTVRITGGGPYNESPLINFSVTLKGDGVKPVLNVPGTSGGPGTTLNGYGISLFTTTEFTGPQTFHLENLTIIPAIGATVTRGIRTNNNTADLALSTDNMKVELVDVLIAPNNGSNLPVSTTGLTAVNLTGSTGFTDDGIFCAGFVDLACTGTIVTHMQGSSTPDGIVFFPDAGGHSLFLGPGNVISYNKRIGIQLAADGTDFDMIGTESNPNVIKGNYANLTGTRNPAVAIFVDNNNLPEVAFTFENTVFVSNNATVLSGWGIDDGESAAPLTANKLAFVNNAEAAVNLVDDAQLPFSFTDCTIVNTGGATGTGTFIRPIIQIGESAAGVSVGTFTMTDCVIAGNGTAGDPLTGENLIAISTTAKPIAFVNSGLPTAGPYALGTGKYKLGAGALAPVETNVKSEDPQFVLVSADFANANFLDVAQPAYDNAATGGADLSGYGDYVGGSSVNNWSIY